MSVTGSAQGFVGICPAGATEPTATLTDDTRGFSPVNVALDSHNNVFVSYDAGLNTPPGAIDEFKAGTTKPIHIGIKSPKGVGWLTVDQNENLVVPSSSGVRVYPPGSKMASLTFGGGKKCSPTQAAINQAGDRVYVSEDGAGGAPVVNAARVYTYPGGTLVDTITNGLPTGNPVDGVIGVAVDPPSSP